MPPFGSAATRMRGSSASTATMAAVSPTSIGVRCGASAMIGLMARLIRADHESFQIEPEGFAFERRHARTERFDRGDHAAPSPKDAVGMVDQHDVGHCGSRRLADGLRNGCLVAVGIERAGRDKRAGCGAADAGVAMN